MGGELYETLALWSPAFGWNQAENNPVVGEYRAIGLDLQGANLAEAARLRAQLDTTRAILEGGDSGQIASLAKGQLVGDLQYAVIYSYLALNDVQDRIQSRLSGIVNYRLPSYGLFSTRLVTSYWFGLPRNVNFSGLNMDVDRLAVQNAAKNNDRQKVLDFMQASGIRASAMEHIVPEQMMSTENNSAQGISAVKALGIASAQGQKIWTITRDNLVEALSALNLSAQIENDIRNAVLAGKVATAHEQPVGFAGGTNTGYLLVDPETGSGAYLIAGGESGSEIFVAGVGILAIGLIGIAGAAYGVLIAPIFLAMVISLALHIILLELLFNDNLSWDSARDQVLAILGIAASAIGFIVSVPITAFVLAVASIIFSVWSLL